LLGGLDAATSRADVLYVSNYSSNTIEKFTSGGGGSIFANAGLDHPQGLAFDSAGNLYAANAVGGGTVEKFTPGGVGSLFATGLSYPTSLAFGSAGNLYAASYGSGTIEKFTPGGVGSLFANTIPGAGPAGLAFDSAGNLYVANSSGNTIEKFIGGVGSVFAITGLSGPDHLAFDSAGNLYAANENNNTIEEFTPGGVGSVFASGGGLNKPFGLAFTNDAGVPLLQPPGSVPEIDPGSMAGALTLLIGGILLLRKQKGKRKGAQGNS
jgi:sugar lactone lactonase YvrE